MIALHRCVHACHSEISILMPVCRSTHTYMYIYMYVHIKYYALIHILGICHWWSAGLGRTLIYIYEYMYMDVPLSGEVCFDQVWAYS